MVENPAPLPTCARYWVIVFAVTLAIITYIDRICIAQAAPLMIKDLGLTSLQMGYVFAVFAWGYGLFEIPTGWLGDWIGPKKVLVRIVIWWSFFTTATGWVWNFSSLLATRFMFGVGESGCFPNLTKVFSIWLPSDERAQAQGIMWMSSRWGGAIAPYLVVLVIQYLSWRRAFELFGAIGIVWAFSFFRWYRDNPCDHKSVNAAELALLPKVGKVITKSGNIPWKEIFSSRAVWLLCLQYFCLNYGWAFYVTRLPTYLQHARGVELQKSGLLAGLPLLLGGLGSLFSGFASAHVALWLKSVIRTRRLMAYVGFCGASAFLMLSIHVRDPVWAMIVMGLASFSTDLIVPGSWSACIDIGGKYAGTVSGTMNMMGSLAGVIAPIATAHILVWTNQNWDITLYSSAAVYLMGAPCWMLLDPVTPIDKVGDDTDEELPTHV